MFPEPTPSPRSAKASSKLTPTDSGRLGLAHFLLWPLELGNRSSKLFGRNRFNGEDIVTPGDGDFDSAFDMLLAFDLAEI
jgi:hypothetical protein